MEHTVHVHHTAEDFTEGGELIDPKIIRSLSTLNPWRSIGQMVFDWVTIIGAIILCDMYWHPLLYVLCVMWIGARQHGLGILLHEAAHYRLVKNKKVNDLIGELFLAFPLIISVKRYRVSHLAHHRHMNTDLDPDWVSKETPDWEFPKSRWEMAVMLIKILFGANLFWMVRLIINGGISDAAEKKPKPSRRFILFRLSYYLALVAVLTYFGWWLHFLLYWFVPLFTWLQFIFRIRSIAEHFGLEDDERLYTGARTTIPNWLERQFLVPHNAWYHLEHHVYPSVPFFNLPQLHQELLDVPAYRNQAHITKGYLGVLKECTAHLK